MSFNHVAIWLDHAQAHLIHFNAEEAGFEIVKIRAMPTHLHTKAGSIGSGRIPEDKDYLEDIAAALKDTREILIVGPGLEKRELLKHLQKHHHEIAKNVLGVETIDHPTDGQLLQVARKFFHKADLMR